MTQYEPNIEPDPKVWLSLDEQVRIKLAEDYHRKEKIKAANAPVHAIFHAIVETRLATGLESHVQAMKRLQGEGLTRHEALHAVACVFSVHLKRAIETDSSNTSIFQEGVDFALARLTKKSWRNEYGSDSEIFIFDIL